MEKERQIALIAAVQQGDSLAANEFFSEIYNDVYYFVFKTVKDEVLAADITQETLIEVFSKIGDLRDPAAFPAWCRQIAFFQCTRYFRKKKDVIITEDEEGGSIFDTLKEDSAEFIPDEALDQKDFRKTILAFIDTLSEEQRSAVMMYYFDELSVSQIAEIQGVSEGTVKSRLNYARKAIKAQVEAYEEKNGTKLHAIGFFPFFGWLFGGEKAGISAPLGAMEKAASAAGLTATAPVAASAAVSAASKGIGIKIAAGALAAAVAIGGVMAIPGTVTKNGERMSMFGAIFSDDTDIDLIIQEGGVYTTYDEETREEIILTGDGKTRFPEPKEGDTYIYGDYGYTYSNDRLHLTGGDCCDAEGWAVAVSDKERVTYGPILEKIGKTPVTVMAGTFRNCTKMVKAPEIPSGVTCIEGAFTGCKSLTETPSFPEGLLDMNSAFIDCDSLSKVARIPGSVKAMDSTFARSFLSDGSELHGATIEIDANPEEYNDCFFQIKNITVTGKTNMAAELEATCSGGILLY